MLKVRLNQMNDAPSEGQVVWLTVRLSPGPVNLYRVQAVYQGGSFFALQDMDAGVIPGEYVGWSPSK